MTFQIGWPQGIWLLIALCGLVQVAVNHGKPQGNYNAYRSLTATLLIVALMWWGGFFG